VSLLWRVAVALPDAGSAHLDEADHRAHSLHPEFKAMGMQEAPGTYPGCKHYDEEHDERIGDHIDAHMDRMRKGGVRIGDVDLTKPTYGMESHFDAGHARALYEGTRTEHPTKGMAHVMVHDGANYVIDGHHRVGVAMLKGQKTMKAVV
jgi:hypothetical protein